MEAAGFDAIFLVTQGRAMKRSKPPTWFWLIALLAAAVLLATSPFWLLAIACNTGSNC